jgi:hypothetical protein
MEESGNNSSEASQTFKFKKPSRKPLRKRLEIDEEDDVAGGSEEIDILYAISYKQYNLKCNGLLNFLSFLDPSWKRQKNYKS